MPGTSVRQGDIGEEEKERIRNMQLDESKSEQEGSEQTDTNMVIEDSSVEGESEVSNPDSTYLDPWEESLKNIARRLQEQEACHSLKQRQLGVVAAEVKRTVVERERQEQCARLRVLAETKERWISLGILKEEDAHLLQSVNGPYHPNIERSRNKKTSGCPKRKRANTSTMSGSWRKKEDFETSKEKRMRRQTKMSSVHSSTCWR